MSSFLDDDLDIETTDLINGIKDYCSRRRDEMLEQYREKRYTINGKPVKRLYIGILYEKCKTL